MRKTKIICTLGPSTDKGDVLRDLIANGMNVARFNFSHGSYEEHGGRLAKLKALREELGKPVAALLDTKGPEIRLKEFKNGVEMLEAGQTFTLTTREVEGTKEICSVTYKDLPQDVQPGGTIMLDDGLIMLHIEQVTDTDIICTVLNSGKIKTKKGVNVPGVHLSMPYLSQKDREDIIFGVQNGFDFIAASFTRNADDIMQIRHIMAEKHCTSINIIAKIENMEGVQNIDEILRVSDAIMVARGDMGVEIPLEEVPVLQKMLIKKCYAAGKPAITATQMLDSMMKNPRPTRAETTDVANAIYDGTSAIMLSGETAAGMYPLEAVKTMARIALRAEASIDYESRFRKRECGTQTDITSAISHATVTSAHDLKASAIITVTKSGTTARVISKYRPSCMIIGCTTSASVWRQLSLSWGVVPLMINEESNTDDLFEHAVDSAVAANLIHDGELVVLTAGVPLGISGTTNLMKVHVVGHMLVKGQGLCGNQVTASLCVAHSEQEAKDTFREGNVLVIHKVTRELLPMLRKATGLILEDSNPDGLGAIAGLSLDIPVIIGACGATAILKSGAVVTMDGAKGTVSCN